MDIIIIGQNEGSSIIKMLDSLKNINGRRIWVLDRCNDNSEELLLQHNEFYIKTPNSLQGRQTSYSRNLGLTFCENTDVLFLDGDRYIVEGDIDKLLDTKYDIELLQLEIDGRYNKNIDELYGGVHNGFFSCGIFIKRNAINKILNFQNGELFREDIQSDWGIEDTYLGDVCYHLGLTCNLNNDIRLHGKFDKYLLDNLEVIEKRFILRDKLNVKWD